MIVVTGGNGLVGSAVCGALRSRGISFVSIVRTPRISESSEVVCDLSRMPLALDGPVRNQVSGVIHLAAAVPHSSASGDTEESASVTRLIDENVVRFVRGVRCPVVYMSTCGLYNRETSVIKREADTDQIRVTGPYFSAKYDGETMFRSESDATVLRLAAPIGIGLRARLVVARFIEQARAGRALHVWGTGRREQSFVDVSDVADIVIRAITEVRNGTYNVAAAAPTTMLELAQTIVDVVGQGHVTIGEREDPQDHHTARYSIDSLRSEYGWLPSVTLEESLRKVVSIDFKE